MAVNYPKQKWAQIQKMDNSRDYILPRRTDEEFWTEGVEQAKIIENHLPKDGLILDYGCGIGRVVKALLNKSYNVEGVDITPDFREQCKQNNIIAHSPEELSNFNERYDFVYSLMVLQHNGEAPRKEIMDNILQILKPGGKVYIQFPQHSSDIYHETPFVHKFTLEEVEEYGKLFSSYNVEEGNLYAYGVNGSIKPTTNHEYILVATK